MFSQSTELYDFIYSEFKDFSAEASQIATLLKEKCPSARRLLDVGCGTGRHAIIEPWMTPDTFRGGSVYLTTVDREELKISRVSRSEVRDRISWIEFQYLVAEPHEIRHLREVHELGLFTEEEMLEALQAGGFQEVEFDPEGLTGRGLYLARTRSS